MTTAIFGVVTVLAVVIGVALCFLALANLMTGLTMYFGAAVIHKKKTMIASILPTVLCALVGMYLLEARDLAVVMGVWLLLAPIPTYWIVNWWCWKTDSRPLRAKALTLRQDFAKRMEVTAPGGTRVWQGYLFDAEMARRRAEYEPPPI